MSHDPNPADGNDYLQPDFPVEVWHGGQRFASADKALLTALAVEDADKPQVMLEVQRDKFTRNPDIAESLLQSDPAAIQAAPLAPTHDLWTDDDVRTALLRVRRELAGEEVMRTGMLLATHGSLVLMERESDLGADLVEGARRAGLDIDIPLDSASLSAFEDAMAEAIAAKWDGRTVELFEMGKTILLFLSMDGLASEEPEYADARAETRRVLQETADRIGLGQDVWRIIDEHGSNPEQIVNILRAVAIAAVD